MRASEIRQLAGRDIMMGECGDEPSITVYFRMSKTARKGVGRSILLSETYTDISLLIALVPWMGRIRWDPRRKRPLHREGISDRVGELAKWDVTSNGLPPSRFRTHCLRSGRSTALAGAGVSLADIRSFGRWGNNTVSIYLLREDAAYKQVGGGWLLL